MDELQNAESAEEYDEQYDKMILSFQHEETKTIFINHCVRHKFGDHCSVYALRKAGLSKNRMTSNGAESVNALLRRHVPKPRGVEADELAVSVFLLMNEQRREITRGYYRGNGEFKLDREFLGRAKGPPQNVRYH